MPVDIIYIYFFRRKRVEEWQTRRTLQVRKGVTAFENNLTKYEGVFIKIKGNPSLYWGLFLTMY